MAYSRPNIVAGVTRLTKSLVDGITGGIEDAHEVLDGRLSDATLSATYARRTAVPTKPYVVATRSKTGNARSATAPANTLSDGTAQGQSVRLRHMATCTAHSIRLVYGNTALGTNGPNAITVKAAVEYLAGAVVPAYFNGQRSVTIQPGGIAISDPIPFEVTDGTNFRTRQYVSVASLGEKWPIGPRVDTSIGDGTAATDMADSGTLSTGNNTFAFGPTAVIGMPVTVPPTVFILGDSILQGVGDATSEPTTDGGWATRALANEYGYINAALAGETAAQFQPGNARRIGRLQLAQYATHALVDYGINDVKADSSTATIQALLSTIWNGLDRMGLKVIQSTLTPVTTGTFTTTGGQTVQATGRETVRKEINAWIRTTPAPLVGYVEAADAAESARDSGIWKPNYTADGTHPNDTGSIAIAAAWNPATALTL